MSVIFCAWRNSISHLCFISLPCQAPFCQCLSTAICCTVTKRNGILAGRFIRYFHAASLIRCEALLSELPSYLLLWKIFDFFTYFIPFMFLSLLTFLKHLFPLLWSTVTSFFWKKKWLISSLIHLHDSIYDSSRM